MVGETGGSGDGGDWIEWWVSWSVTGCEEPGDDD